MIPFMYHLSRKRKERPDGVAPFPQRNLLFAYLAAFQDRPGLIAMRLYEVRDPGNFGTFTGQRHQLLATNRGNIKTSRPGLESDTLEAKYSALSGGLFSTVLGHAIIGKEGALPGGIMIHHRLGIILA